MCCIVSKVFIINKDLKKLLTQNINISINYNNHNKEIVESIEKLSNKFPGNYNLVLHLKSLKGINQKVLIKKIKFSIIKFIIKKHLKIIFRTIFDRSKLFYHVFSGSVCLKCI